MLFLSMTLFSQLKVSDTEKSENIGEFKSLGKTFAELNKHGDLAILTYRDEKFMQIDDYKSFSFDFSDLDTLYTLFSDFEDNVKGDSKTVDLPNGDKLVFNYKKTMGKMYAEVFHHSKAGTTGLLRWMTPKQVSKLFGKR